MDFTYQPVERYRAIMALLLRIFLSQTVRARAFIFGMKHLLVDLYQVCLDYAPGVKIGPHPGDHKLEHRNKESHLQNSSPVKLEGVELWYLVLNISLWTSTKTGPARGHSSQLQNSSSLKLEGLQLWYLVFSISLRTFIYLIHMIPLVSKTDPWGHKLEHRNKEDQLQNSSSLKLEGIELRFSVCSISL